MNSHKQPDGGDGSNRLFYYACRGVGYDLTDKQIINAVRVAEALRPFPRTYSDAEILQRVRDAESKVVRRSARAESV